jgi:hypothetical protein
MRSVLAAIGLSVLGGMGAMAQEPTNGSSDIIVHGTRDPVQVREFVHSVSAIMPVGQMARWNNNICPGVVGANWQQAQVIIDQVARRAMALGLNVGRTGCAANLTIIVTGDVDHVVQAIYHERRVTLINPNNVDGATLGEAALQDFVTTSRPVRWWHIAVKTSDDGHTLTDQRADPINLRASSAIQGTTDTTAQMSGAGSASAAGFMPGTVGEGASGMQGVRSNGSRLSRATRHDFNSVLVIVDTTRLNGASASAVADYVAFVSLAQINPSVSQLPFPSILNLFSAQDASLRPTSMSGWDIDYLDGLYHATRAARNIGQQESDITQRMTTPRAAP